jgi:tight adherence protein B
MSLDPLLIAYVAVFVCVLLFVEGVYYLLVDNRTGIQQRNINRRMQWLAEGVERSAVLSRLRRKPPEELSGLSAKLLSFTVVRRVEGLLARAGLALELHRFVAYVAIAFLCLFSIFIVLGVPAGLAVVSAAAIAIAVPLFIVARKGRQRMARMEDQLPDALDMIVRSLRAGHPIATAINLVAREMPDPIGSEFGLVADEMAFGLDLQSALENMSGRIDFQDLRFMVMTIKMQAITGGNLAEVLGSLARLIRERHRLHLKVLALSSEGRFSVKILVSLPFGFFSLISLITPKYYGAMLAEPVLIRVVEIGVAMLAIGIYLMRRVVNFRV